MDHGPSAELLNSTHTFPCVYKIKAIGNVGESFEERVLAAVQSELGPDERFESSARTTPGGRHVSVTMDVPVKSAEQVRAIYRRIREVPQLTLLL